MDRGQLRSDLGVELTFSATDAVQQGEDAEEGDEDDGRCEDRIVRTDGAGGPGQQQVAGPHPQARVEVERHDTAQKGICNSTVVYSLTNEVGTYLLMVMKLRTGRRRQSLCRRRSGRRAESWRRPTSHQSPPSPRLEESSPHIPPPSISPPSTAVKSEIRIQSEVQYYNVYNGVTGPCYEWMDWSRNSGAEQL